MVDCFKIAIVLHNFSVSNCHIAVLNVLQIVYYQTLQLATEMALNATHVLGNMEAFAPEW